MAKNGQQSNELYFVDKWCAKNIRKVKSCKECMHCEECTKAGHSLAPSAIEHAALQGKRKNFSYLLDDDDDEM